MAVTLTQVEAATRCVLYPDTSVCGLSSALQASGAAWSCRLLIREAALQVYLRTGGWSAGAGGRRASILTCWPVSLSPSEWLPVVTSVSVPGHGTLRGAAAEAALGSGRRTVVQFLGVPYARPPIGALRFEEAQPADWTGTWDATRPR